MLRTQGEEPYCFWLAYAATPEVEMACEEKEIEDKSEPQDTDDISTDSLEEKTNESKDAIFECPTCSAAFIRMRNLILHQDSGKHKIRPEKLSMHDSALNLYGRYLEELQQSTIIKEIDDSIAALTTPTSEALPEGWALKKKRTNVRHSETAKKFIEKYYDEGATTGRKYDPSEVERLMLEDEGILPSERLTAQQIKSYYSSLCRKREKEGAKRPKREAEEGTPEECEDYDQEGFESIKDVGKDVYDAVREIIHENLGAIFDQPENPLLTTDE